MKKILVVFAVVFLMVGSAVAGWVARYYLDRFDLEVAWKAKQACEERATKTAERAWLTGQQAGSEAAAAKPQPLKYKVIGWEEWNAAGFPIAGETKVSWVNNIAFWEVELFVTKSGGKYRLPTEEESLAICKREAKRPQFPEMFFTSNPNTSGVVGMGVGENRVVSGGNVRDFRNYWQGVVVVEL
jgi:hypothetical protein